MIDTITDEQFKHEYETLGARVMGDMYKVSQSRVYSQKRVRGIKPNKYIMNKRLCLRLRNKESI